MSATTLLANLSSYGFNSVTNVRSRYVRKDNVLACAAINSRARIICICSYVVISCRLLIVLLLLLLLLLSFGTVVAVAVAVVALETDTVEVVGTNVVVVVVAVVAVVVAAGWTMLDLDGSDGGRNDKASIINWMKVRILFLMYCCGYN